jgi:hypothetical protein
MKKKHNGRGKAYCAKPSRVTLILAAHERVKLAADQLSQLSSLDPRFADAINEYRDALDARDAAVNTRRSQLAVGLFGVSETMDPRAKTRLWPSYGL